jgi:hypothetical protein|tara:strand:- start:1448 stop:2770 length:1323 start_codon:yes stop_codon:yes gene_type:complete
MEVTLNERLQKKWSPILEHNDLSPIKDNWRRNCVTQLLENQERYLKEAAPVNQTVTDASGSTNIDKWDPILISLVRRAMPNLIAYDVCGVQPMSGPTGLIFAMRSRYQSQTGQEALYFEADTSFSAGTGSTSTNDSAGVDPFANTVSSSASGFGGASAAMTTNLAEALGDNNTTNPFAEMAFTIEQTSVTAKTRALKAEYTTELAQDLKAIHGLDAETELANILSNEILAEINREIIRRIYEVAKLGCRSGTTTSEGIFDLNTDSNGRWSVERFKGLLFQIEREANFIAKDTRRGKGNFILCSSDVASALAMAGVLDYTPALNADLNVDDTGNTFAGTINGRLKVYIDPYYSTTTTKDFALVGYRGSSPYDAGLFYCPYVPLQMVRAVGENTFQPKIGFKTRYGLVSNPFVSKADGTADAETLTARRNQYYRIFRIDNLV